MLRMRKTVDVTIILKLACRNGAHVCCEILKKPKEAFILVLQ